MDSPATKIDTDDIAVEVLKNYQLRFVDDTGSAFFEKRTGEQVTKTRSNILICFREIGQVIRGTKPRLKTIMKLRRLAGKAPRKPSRAETEEQVRYRNYLEVCRRLNEAPPASRFKCRA